jgi:hypothetical protein
MGRKTVFTEEQEWELCDHLLQFSDSFFGGEGVTLIDLWWISYEFAEQNNVKHNCNE